MPRRTGLHLLSAVGLRNLPPGRHADGGGLYLAVSPNGVGRSWVFRSRRAGKLRELGLGSLRDRGLAEARRKARELREAFLDGRDPLAERRAAKQAAQVEAAKATTSSKPRKPISDRIGRAGNLRSPLPRGNTR